MLIIFSRKLILKYYIARFELLIFKVERSFQMARSASGALCRAGAGGDLAVPHGGAGARRRRHRQRVRVRRCGRRPKFGLTLSKDGFCLTV